MTERGSLLKAAAGPGIPGTTGGGPPAPAFYRSAAARTLRFVPRADPADVDPIWGAWYAMRNVSGIQKGPLPFFRGVSKT